MKNSKPKASSFLVESSAIQKEDILSQLSGSKGTSLFLGKYSLNEVAAVLKKRNFFKEARKRNLFPLDFELDSSEFPLQRLQIFHQTKIPDNIIVDLKIKEGRFRLKDKFALKFLSSEYDFLFLEWLTLQNPLQDFSQESTPLPGQNHPGLNLGRKVLDLFIYLGRITKKDGLLAFPAYFHNALLFSRYFHFVNPEKEGEVQAIRKAFKDVPFKQLAWIVHLNCLKWKDNQIYEWQAEPEAHPLNKSLQKYFDSRAYKEKVKDTQQNLRLSIDWDNYRKKTAEPGWHII